MAENPFAAAPFAAAMTQMQDQAKKAAEEFGRMFKTIPPMPGMPGMPTMPGTPDMSGWMATHQRNLEALAAANRIAMEGAQAVGRRQLEIVQQTIAELTDTMKALGTITTPEAAKAAVNPEAVKDAYTRAVAHSKELADLMQRANADAIEVLHTRVASALDEAKALAGKV